MVFSTGIQSVLQPYFVEESAIVYFPFTNQSLVSYDRSLLSFTEILIYINIQASILILASTVRGNDLNAANHFIK